MKLKLTLAIAILISFTSCKQQQSAKKDDSPVVSQALENKGNSSVFSKRSGDNVVESMYDELTEKTPELLQLKKQISEVRDMSVDSVAAYNDYRGKIDNYYRDAERMSVVLLDSNIRVALIDALKLSKANYNQSIKSHEALRDLIISKNIEVNDLYVLLKVMRTLPVIAEYQQKNLPSTNPLQATGKQLDEVIQKMKSAAKK